MDDQLNVVYMYTYMAYMTLSDLGSAATPIGVSYSILLNTYYILNYYIFFIHIYVIKLDFNVFYIIYIVQINYK